MYDIGELLEVIAVTDDGGVLLREMGGDKDLWLVTGRQRLVPDGPAGPCPVCQPDNLQIVR